MAPVAVTTNYYLVLQLSETATLEDIKRQYRKLALAYHPDKNKALDAKQQFQQLNDAYEVLREESKRRHYDTYVYPRVKETQKASESSNHQSKPVPPDTAELEKDRYLAAIAKIRREMESRTRMWERLKKFFEDNIFELNRDIRKVQMAISDIDEIEKAVVAEEAAGNSWTAWIISPFKKQPVKSKEEKEQKGRDRLDRFHSKEFKKSRLKEFEERLQDFSSHLAAKKIDFDDANSRDDTSIVTYYLKIQAIQEREDVERERVAREARMKAERERMEKERQATEAREKAEAKRWEAIRKERREAIRKERQEAEKQQKEHAERMESNARKAASRNARAQERSQTKGRGSRNNPKTQSAHASWDSQSETSSEDNCLHRGWWDKVEGRADCENCLETHFKWILQCPDCLMRACANCRPKLQNRRN